MLRFVFITLAILSGVQGTTYSFCNGLCSISFTPACGTMLYVDGTQWRCSQFKIPSSYPASIGSCPGDIVLNQTDNTVVCLNRRCPGKMVAYTSGWECEDPTCPWPLRKLNQAYVVYQQSDFDYVCPVPDCKGSPVKNTNVSWACDTTAYEQGQVDYRDAHIWLVIGVILLIMTTVAALCNYLGKKSAKRISSSQGLVNSSMSM